MNGFKPFQHLTLSQRARLVCRLPASDRPRGRLKAEIEQRIRSGMTYREAIAAQPPTVIPKRQPASKRNQVSRLMKAVWSAYRAAKAASKLSQ